MEASDSGNTDENASARDSVHNKKENDNKKNSANDESEETSTHIFQGVQSQLFQENQKRGIVSQTGQARMFLRLSFLRGNRALC